MLNESKWSLLGSERDVLIGARWIEAAHPDERCEVSVICRRPNGPAFDRHMAMMTAEIAVDMDDGRTTAPRRVPEPASPALSRDAYEARFSADPGDLEQVRRFAGLHGLRVVREDVAARTTVLAGSADQMNHAFGISLQRYAHAAIRYRGHAGPVRLPEELSDVIVAVLGLDDRPQAVPKYRRREPTLLVTPRAAARSFTPLDLAKLYNFPAGDGAGQCIGIIELGGGYDTRDLQTYFSELGVPSPQVLTVSVDGGKNNPSQDPYSADGEVMLDIEIAGAIAPRAKIAVYFAPNTDAGFIDSLNAAVFDRTNRPSVVSISWGKPEAYWSVQALRAFDDALQSAASMGVTVCVASGDDGSSDGINDGIDHVDFPAASPYALACGGTRLISNSGGIENETVWNNGLGRGAGGGGISNFFGLPDWQRGLTVRYRNGRGATLMARGVPDIAGVGDPQTGYQVIVHGEQVIIGGTSAVSPLWSGLIARINSTAGRSMGFMHPRLYRSGRVCNDVTQGTNGDFAATSGWDACTGFGSPNGVKVATLI